MDKNILPYIKNARERIARIAAVVPSMFLCVDTAEQTLTVLDVVSPKKKYRVSTARNGVGAREQSFMTPPGVHRICEKYGAGAPLGRVFRDRIDTGEEWAVGVPGENLILTRIMRLEGLESGVNKGPGIDSYERYIYIHGTNNEHMLGTPFSHGCICMSNADVAELFDTVTEGTIVVID